MAISAADPDRSALSAVKAVSPGYPLRGTLRVADAIGQGDRATREIPARGEVWVDGQLLQAIGAAPGDALKLGEKAFRISKIIAIEPDRGTQFINFAPRVMLNIEDLAATQLIANGSRVTYRLLVAGERPAVQTYSEVLQKGLQRGQRIETLEGGRPEMQRTIDRAERFLALVALLAAMIAAVAVAASARRFSLRHLDSCAMMRCLGLAQADIFRLFALEFLIIGLAACIAGMVLGYATHYVLLNALGSLIQNNAAAAFVTTWCSGVRMRAGVAAWLRSSAVGAAAPRSPAARAAQGRWFADGTRRARLSCRAGRFLRVVALVV